MVQTFVSKVLAVLLSTLGCSLPPVILRAPRPEEQRSGARVKGALALLPFLNSSALSPRWRHLRWSPASTGLADPCAGQ